MSPPGRSAFLFPHSAFHTVPLVVLVVGCAGCGSGGSPAPVVWEDPVGIRVAGGPGSPAFAVALQVNRGSGVRDLVEPLIGTLYTAITACPGFGEGPAAGDVTTIAFVVVDGRIGAPRAAPQGNGALCVVRKLDGKPLLPQATARRDVRLQILRAPEAAGAGESP